MDPVLPNSAGARLLRGEAGLQGEGGQTHSAGLGSDCDLLIEDDGGAAGHRAQGRGGTRTLNFVNIVSFLFGCSDDSTRLLKVKLSNYVKHSINKQPQLFSMLVLIRFD